MAINDFTPGIYSDVPEDDYHARKFGPAESLSQTEAKTLLRAPSLLQHARRTSPAKNKAFIFGRVVHSLVLGEGAKVHVSKYADMRSNAAKEEAAEFEERGYVVVSERDFRKMRECADAVKSHPLASTLLSSGLAEQSMFCQDDKTGAWMRGRVDWLTAGPEGESILIDLKTSESAHHGDFTRSAAKFDYAVQVAWYQTMWETLKGEREPRFLHIVVEKNPPYMVAVYEMTYEFQEVGKMKMRRALDTYKQCLDTGEWPGIPPVVHPLIPPAYYVGELLDLESEIEI